MIDTLSALLAELYPARCAACDLPSDERLFCVRCAETLVPIGGDSCPRCGIAYLGASEDGAGHVCGRCLSAPPCFTRATAAFAYGGALRAAIARWKNGGHPWMGPHLAALALGCSPHAWLADVPLDSVLVPVPARRKALTVRGFNPAGIIARGLAGATALALRPDALAVAGRRGTKGLGRAARISRARGAFRAHRRRVEGRDVVVVDDVMTTGATVEAAARACLGAGAASVRVRVLAHVPA